METNLCKVKNDFLEAWENFKVTGEINDALEFIRCLALYDEFLKQNEEEKDI